MLNVPFPFVSFSPGMLPTPAMPATPVVPTFDTGGSPPPSPEATEFAVAFCAAANFNEPATMVDCSIQDLAGAASPVAARFSSILEDRCAAAPLSAKSAPPDNGDGPDFEVPDEFQTDTATFEYVTLIAQILPSRDLDMLPIALRRADAEIPAADAKQPLPLPALQLGISMATGTGLDLASVPAADMPLARPAFNQFTLDLARSDWVATLSTRIEAALPDRHEFSVRLAPAHLGTVDLAIADTAQGLVIDLRTGSDDAAQLFARDESRLLEELRHRGVPVAEYILRNGLSDDGRGRQSGANADGFRPYQEADRFAIKDQDRESAPTESGRFA